jgi:hypothetical protein
MDLDLIIGENSHKSLIAELNDGHSFRGVVEFLAETVPDGNFVFDANGITFIRCDAENGVTNRLIIDRHRLPLYIYNGESTEIVFGVTLGSLRNVTKNISRQGALLLLFLSEDPNMYLQIIGNTRMTNNQNYTRITFQKLNDVVPDIIQYKRHITEPNCTITIKELYHMTNSLSGGRGGLTKIVVYPSSIKFEAETTGSITKSVFNFGVRQPLEDKKNEITFNIRSNVIKALAKLNNVSCTNATMQIYAEEDRPLKMILQLGTYGRLIIYFKSIKNT